MTLLESQASVVMAQFGRHEAAAWYCVFAVLVCHLTLKMSLAKDHQISSIIPLLSCIVWDFSFSFSTLWRLMLTRLSYSASTGDESGR
jgi:hypothetical protein